jgi:hypothetical protein
MYNGKHQQQPFFLLLFHREMGKKKKEYLEKKTKKPIGFGEEKFHNHDVPSKYTRKFLPVHNNLAKLCICRYSYKVYYGCAGLYGKAQKAAFFWDPVIPSAYLVEVPSGYHVKK